ncbi:hypothetical protein CFC21_040667 [Triticum aestivum]|uniref:DNA sliding clamp PCNA n=2 Tax=Triticum aestivum TaxID=4565 RepID=A0A3B6FPD1_WHEAT|nr:uncharacterized protein LOC123070462 [Triticum aestivum]KAF7028805.1 hypothetical protein CFC21_040667 [Triticum aestivum]
MFELKMVKGSTLQGVLEAILDLVNVANVDCSSEGFSLQALDTEHVVFLSLFFPSEAFQSYRCDEDRSMGIAIADMVDFLRSSNDGDIITIKATDQNLEDITITLESPDKIKTMAIDLRLVDATSQCLKIPDWNDMESDYQAIFCMPSEEFRLNCKSLSVIDDDVVISVNEEVISFSTKGESGCVNISHVMNKTDKPEKASVILTHARGPLSLTLNWRYMKSCAKVSKLFDQVKIGLSTKRPLMVECQIVEKGYIRYFVAPLKAEEGKTETEEAEGEEGRQRKKAKKNDETGSIFSTMLELRMVKAKGSIFEDVLEAILDLVNVANVNCSSKGFSLQAVDTEQVVFLALFFPPEVFQSYRCDKHCSMGIAIADIVNFLRASKDGDIITIKVTDQNFEDITITFVSPDKTKTTAMNLRLVDDRSHRLKIPDWQDMESEYQAIFCMPSKVFMLNCKSLSVIDDDVVIKVNEKVISFFTSGERRCMNISHVLNKTDKRVTLTHARGPVSLALNLRYMKSCAKVSSTLFDQVKIGLSTTLPLMVECIIAEKGYIRYFVAPLKEEEGRQRKKAKKKRRR